MSERPEFETVERWMNAHARRAHQGTGVEVAECQSSCVPAFAALDSLRAYVEELEGVKDAAVNAQRILAVSGQGRFEKLDKALAVLSEREKDHAAP